MKRFLLTSDKFSGTAELIYADTEQLVCIDMRNAIMTADIITAFKRAVPVLYTEQAIKTAFTSGTVIVEADFEVTFDMWWEKYNRKINKKRCLPIWGKTSKVKQVKAYYGIDPYDRYLARNNWRSKADPENFLKSEMYETEWNKL